MERAIVIGLSSGGMNALNYLFSSLPIDFQIPVIIVQHVSPRSESEWIKWFAEKYGLRIAEAVEKEPVLPQHIYIAPPNYHLLIESDRTFSLTIDERVNFARPSIDVLFESAADAYRSDLTGIVLTGANHDGARGLHYIHQQGGRTIIQDPATAESSAMPASVLKLFQPDHVLSLEEIAALLITENNSLKRHEQ
jgi:two-component system chemotaxis response regulator CheB